MKEGGDEVFYLPPISVVTTGEGAGEGKCSQDQSRSLSDNYFQVRAAGGPASGAMGTFLWDSSSWAVPSGDWGLWEGSEGVCLSEHSFLWLFPLLLAGTSQNVGMLWPRPQRRLM